MLVYFVKWSADEDLTKGKGRICLGELVFCFTVLCRSSRDASSCLLISILFIRETFYLSYNMRTYVHSDGQTIKKVCLLVSLFLRLFTKFRYIGSYV